MKVSFSNCNICNKYQYFIITILAIICFYLIAFYISTAVFRTVDFQFLFQIFIFLILFISFQFFIQKNGNKNLVVTIKNAEEIIQRYDALSNATNDAIWDYDLVTEKVFYNDRLMSIFGYSKEELLDNTTWWQNNIHFEDKERVINKMNILLEKNRTTWEDEYRFRCKNGEYKTVFDRSYIVRDKNKKALRLIGAMKDVTLLRTLEKQLIQKQLKEKNLLGKKIIVSHEIERKKVKDELHEDVNQLLAFIKIYISTNKSNYENLSQSLVYLDDVMFKINKISNALYSSTLDMLGFEDAVKDLFEKYRKHTSINFMLNLSSFNEALTDKNNILHLYRIIENRLIKIISFINTTKIIVVVLNDEHKVTLKIQFESDDENIAETLNDSGASDINVKLEMYEGKMKLISVGEGNYTIVVVI